MFWTRQRPSQQMVKTFTWRRLMTAGCILTLVAAILVGAVVTYRARAAQPRLLAVVSNFQVDQDQSLPFPQNKQNEPAIAAIVNY